MKESTGAVSTREAAPPTWGDFMAPDKEKSPLRMALVLALAGAVALFGCSESGGRQQGPSTSNAAQPGNPDLELSGTSRSVAQSVSPPQSRSVHDSEKSGLSAEKTSPPAASAAPGPRKKPAPVSKGGPGTERTTEKISGYAVPAEYLLIQSRNYPHAVVAVTLPEDYEDRPDKKYPLVIVFGGAGECARPPRDGALAWMHYYKADEAMRALRAKELTKADFRGLVKQSELDSFNRRLRKQPYSGMILACPYSPMLTPQAIPEFADYEAFVMQELVPALEKRYRVAPDSIGVDGVSMGGARAMYYGLKYPEVFSSIGSVQGAFGPFLDVYRDLVAKNKRTLKNRSIQLVTSDGDVLAGSVEKMHQVLKAGGITHRYLTLTGPHDYIFNQGPGSLALLVFHDQVLSRKAAGLAK